MSKTNNKITNVKAVFEALQKFKPLRFKKFIKKDEVKTEEKTEVKKPFTKKKENKIDNK